MLNIERVREILGKSFLSDQDLEDIRDECDAWAELVIEAIEHSGEEWERENWSDWLKDDTSRI